MLVTASTTALFSVHFCRVSVPAPVNVPPAITAPPSKVIAAPACAVAVPDACVTPGPIHTEPEAAAVTAPALRVSAVPLTCHTPPAGTVPVTVAVAAAVEVRLPMSELELSTVSGAPAVCSTAELALGAYDVSWKALEPVTRTSPATLDSDARVMGADATNTVVRPALGPSSVAAVKLAPALTVH